jgi:hypothetical protein
MQIGVGSVEPQDRPEGVIHGPHLIGCEVIEALGQLSGRAAKSRLTERYQPSPETGRLQRPFIWSRAGPWAASPPATISLRCRSWAWMTSSAVRPRCGWSQGPPICLHVIVFIQLTANLTVAPLKR